MPFCTDWLTLVKSTNDINESAVIFQNSLCALYNECFLERKVRIRASDLPWVRPSLKIMIDDRDRAFHRRQWGKYRSLRKEVVIHIKHRNASLSCLHLQTRKTLGTHYDVSVDCGCHSVSATFLFDDFNNQFTYNFPSLACD